MKQNKNKEIPFHQEIYIVTQYFPDSDVRI